MILFYGLRYRPEKPYPGSVIDINVVSDYRKIRAILSIGDKDLEEDILARIVQEEAVSIKELVELFVLTRETEFLFDSKALISLLFYMGYLTIAEKSGFAIILRIPNMVLKSLYLDYMAYVLMKRAQVRIDGMKKDEMLRDLVDGDIDPLIALTEKLLKGLFNRDYRQFDEKYVKLVMLSLLSDVDVYIPRSEYEVGADGFVDLYLQAAYEPERSASHFIELKYAKAAASETAVDKKAREARRAMKTYLQSKAAKAVTHLRPWVLVFQKDQCVRKINCLE